MVTLVKHDLEFILKQILIAEQHAAGADLADLVGSPLLPAGLRTVDGSYNNIVPGRENWGASDQPFLRLTEESWATGTGTMSPMYNANSNYYGNGGNVTDSSPRLISNLIVDQTLDNPAAIYAALVDAGEVASSDLLATIESIQAAHQAVKVADAALKALPLGDEGIAAATTALADAKAILDGELDDAGIVMDGSSVFLSNRAPDEGLSASYNSFFTLFGQFFDHGLDLVKKGGNGTVYIPLSEDDPLYDHGPMGQFTNFMAVSRATTGDGAANVTTPWVDQNQTYTSNASHQVFLREYIMTADGPVATGKLLEGARGLATWADVKAQARDLLGIELTDLDVGRVPMLAVDPYGEFIRGDNGLPQLVVLVSDGNGGYNPTLVEGDLANPVDPSAIGAARVPHAFLDDIAHVATPVAINDVLQPDDDNAVGYSGEFDYMGRPTTYDNELLDAHYITGDGRGNENIGLSAVHHLFHSEHNRLVDHIKDVILATNDAAFIAEWRDGAGNWDGERLFQAARFTTEMQYQHLVFEEFARKVQPDVDIFIVQPNVEINPAIFAEFAHVVYRFGHSMLNETVDRINADGSRADMTLFDAFLNPLAFGSETVHHDVAAGAIIRGMTGQVGNEIDEFVTNVLRNQLLGIPLDLATINIARGRDTGMPTLNEARAQFMAMAGGDTQLRPYDSWSDFAVNMKNPASIVNFIAAYGTHESITGTAEERRDAAFKIVFGGAGAPGDRTDFVNGTGAWANQETGLNHIDLWVGGLAEKKMPFGGLLGSTFSFIFELQMENLQDADRFYYLSRTQGLNLLTELENNSLAKIVMRNTDLSDFALPGDIFSVPDHVLYVDLTRQLQMTQLDDPEHEDPFLEAMTSLVERGVNYLRYNGADHTVIMGTDGDDHIIAGGGDDTVWGGKGNDRIEAGYGVDKIHGGDGDDIITNAGTDIGETDMLHGEAGNDVIHGGSGHALIFGGSGQDFLMTGKDGSEIRGGTGNDFIMGGDGPDFLFGNEGDDWIEAGGRADYIAGDNGELFFNSTIIGHDVLNGGGGDTDYDADSGDDIMVAGEGIQKFIGMWGHDWVIHKGQQVAADADMNVEVFTTLPLEVLRDRFSQVEAVSGWKYDDVIRGDNRSNEVDELLDTQIPDPTPEGNFLHNELDQAGIDRIGGLSQIITADMMRQGQYWADGSGVTKQIFDAGNILLGGGGSDLIEGRGGNDVIDGDAWLNVRIGIRADKDDPESEFIAWADGMSGKVYAWDNFNSVTGQPANPDQPLNNGQSLDMLMLSRGYNPGQLHIVREILWDNSGIDTAVYWDVYENYDISANPDGSLRVEHVTQTPGAVDPITGKNRVSDGVDTLYNIEVLRFANGVEVPTSNFQNSLATGEVRIASNGNNTNLQASVIGLADANGLPPNNTLSYEWQLSADNGATWQTIPTNGGSQFNAANNTGQLIRANLVFTDLAGNPERITSTNTARVGTGGPDTLLGTDGPNILVGLNGADTLLGGAGDDILYGGGGADVLMGGAGNDFIDGGGANDVAVYAGPATNFNFARNGADLVMTDLTGAEGVDTLVDIENLRFDGLNGASYSIVQGNNNNVTVGQTLNGGAGSQIVFGWGGNDTLNGGAGNDILVGGTGDDTLDGGTGDDLILWRVGDGRDVVDGGTGTDTFHVAGDATAETYHIWSRDAWSLAGNSLAGFHALSEIIITRGATNTVVAELRNVEEIVINGRGGGDAFTVHGSFENTSLAYSTVTLEGGAGDDRIDISELQSAHRIVFKGNGGNDVIVGQMRPQDEIEMLEGLNRNDYQVQYHTNGSTTVFAPGHSVTFFGTPNMGGQPIAANTNAAPITSYLSSEDLKDLREMVQEGFIRDASGVGNNVANPSWGSAGYEFIRLTNPYYEDGVSAIRQTTLNPREISNIVSNQDNNGDGVEESIPNSFGGSALLTFFGQYFDHGLSFVAKGNPGNVLIGDVNGTPLNAPRSNIANGTGYDEDDVAGNGNEVAAQYINQTSPFVDQNQTYGSHDEITDLLRKWQVGSNGQGQQTAYLLVGDMDAGGRALLPTLNHIRENFRIMTNGDELTSRDISDYQGTGQPLLIDFIPAFLTLPDEAEPLLDLDAIGHYFVTGDGRANENVMLTTIHTIWARNHNFWVDQLKAQTNNAWSEEEYFQAARIMNVAEYQRVVFTEFTEAMAGGLGDDDSGPDDEHGFDGYDPNVDASISVEFAQAVYRFGHSMLNETVSYVDENGQLQHISLVDAFLRPDQVGALGIDALLKGAVAVPHQAIDVDVVNALRNQLVGRPLDLAALNIFRGRDMGVAPFNIVRAELFAQTGLNSLRPYQGWEDFQQRNGLSNDFIAQLKEAYPDGFDTMDLWIGGLAEKPRHGQLGSTFGYIFLEQMNRLQHGDRFYYLEILDDDIFQNNPQSFADIIMRNTGLTDLPQNIFLAAPTGTGTETPPVDDDDDDVAPNPNPNPNPIDDEDEDNTEVPGTEEPDPTEDPDGPSAPVTGTNLIGTANADVLLGTDGNDTLIGYGGDDTIMGGDGDDVILGGDGNDALFGDAGRDVIFGGAGNDHIFGGDGDDMLFGDEGNDVIMGGAGNDYIKGGAGDDVIYGGAGNDVFVAEVGDGNDTYYGDEAWGGTGNDTLDMSAITANITVDLGTGAMGNGFAKSSQTGHDTLWGIENVITGSGNDVIIASRAVNIMDGGEGNDIFRFLSAQDADGDTILGFQPGDRIDLSGIDADAGVSGNQTFTLMSGEAFTGRGQLIVTYESRDDGDYTVVQGNTSGGADADFKISIKGSHNLTSSDFTL
jgi:Ca2+-binding RTX toxin-like protein